MDFTAQLNDPSKTRRIIALSSALQAEQSGLVAPPVQGGFVNNHIHTVYSFSPYSPTAAVFNARAAGLQTAGIMDHDSVGGAAEFCEAGALCDMPVTCGFEVRLNLSASPFADRRVNNPDQDGVAYVACHGIPRNRIAQAEAFLAPLREARNIRNRAMTLRLNELLAAAQINLDFDEDVMPLSKCREGGSITERHLLYAAGKALIERVGKGAATAEFLTSKLGLKLSEKQLAQMSDPLNQYYEYDLLGILKGGFVKSFYLPATDELPTPEQFISFVKSIGAVSAYAYLGDVGDSVTGDKAAAKFEDGYLDDLFGYIKRLGFDAVTYMPSRNTPAQLERVMALCAEHNFLQISGEDINSPRQSFVCQALSRPEFSHLHTATWALIGHELAATADIADSICGARAAQRYPEMAKRVEAYAELAHNLTGK